MRPEKGRLIEIVRGRCPPNPPGFCAWGLAGRTITERTTTQRSSSFRISHPARRSGCVPAEPYPPTRQHQNTNHCSTCKENDNINHQPTTMCHNLILPDRGSEKGSTSVGVAHSILNQTAYNESPLKHYNASDEYDRQRIDGNRPIGADQSPKDQAC